MILTKDSRRKVYEQYGAAVASVCDGCGAILGSVRYTKKDQGGEWCSRECRDGKKAVEQYNMTRKHRGKGKEGNQEMAKEAVQ